MPRTALFRGSIDGWKLADSTVVAAVLPAAGGAADGQISLAIDAPVVNGPTVAAQSDVPVVAGAKYTFSASVRVLQTDPMESQASVDVGESTFAIPATTSVWTKVKGTFTAPEGVSSLPLKIELKAPVRGLEVDDVRISRDGGGENAVPNGSFEAVEAARGLLNDSLVMSTSTATAVLGAGAPSAWSVTDVAGTALKSGTVEQSASVRTIPLAGLPQGYYGFRFALDDGTVVSAPLAVVDLPTAFAATDPRLGAMLHVERDYYTGSVRTAASVGFGAIRNDILWRLNETTRGTYVFTQKYDLEFGRARANGIGLLGVAAFGNPLYDAGRAPTSPGAVAAYGRYVDAIVHHYDLVGLEVYNEFNQSGGACGKGADCYLPMLKAASAAMKSAGSKAPIISGVTARYDAAWFDQLWKLGGAGGSDAFSFHPYEVYFDVDSLAGVISRAQATLKADTGMSKPVWITELGWTTKTGGTSTTDQAGMLVRAEVVALASGAQKYFWYDLMNDSTDPADHEGNFGLFTRATPSVAAPAPKPAALAQAILTAKIGGIPFSKDESTPDGVRVMAFGSGREKVDVVWSPTAGTVKIPAANRMRITGVDGSSALIEPVDGVVTVTASSSPVFVDLAAD